MSDRNREIAFESPRCGCCDRLQETCSDNPCEETRPMAMTKNALCTLNAAPGKTFRFCNVVQGTLALVQDVAVKGKRGQYVVRLSDLIPA